MEKSAGIGAFARNPEQATIGYFLTATPAQFAADTIGVALTFAPGNFAGAAFGRGIRGAVADYSVDPAAFAVSRRAALDGDVGVIQWSAFSRREPAESVLGNMIEGADEAAYAGAIAFRESFPAGPIKATGAARGYQSAVTSGPERLIPMSGNPRPASVDDIGAEYGARIVDAKYVRETGTSWNNPGGLSHTGAREAATLSIDKAILRAHNVSVSAGLDGSVQMTTNSAEAALFIEERMRSLGIDGIVVMHPGKG